MLARALLVTLATTALACSEEPPSPSPTPAESAAKANARALASSLLAPPAPPEPPEAARIEPLLEIGGFSADGKTFAYADKSAFSGNLYVKKANVGADWPTQDSVDDLAGARALLAKGAYARPKPVPADVTFTAALTTTPPTLTLKRGARTAEVKLGDAMFPATDRAELLGVSPDEKYVVIHVAGPDVPGVFSKGGGGTVHFVVVAALP